LAFNEWWNFVAFFADSPTHTLQGGSEGLVISARDGTVSEDAVLGGESKMNILFS
jgi:hypothetical protein